MSYLAQEIEKILQEEKLTQADIARGSELDPTKISRWRTGIQAWIDPDDLEKLSIGFKNPRKAHARLLRAHLLDTCAGKENLVNIEIADPYAPAIMRDSPAPYGVLPPKIDNALKVIVRKITVDKDLRDIITSMANLYEHGTLADAEETNHQPTKPKKEKS